MLDSKYVLENLESVEKRLADRGQRISFEDFVRVSREKKDVLKRAEDLRAVKNKASEEVSRLKKEGKDAAAIIAEMRKVGDEIGALEERLKAFDEELRSTLLNIPNIPHESVPVGRGAEDNREVRRWGSPPELGFEAKAHWDVGEKLGILDFERAAKIAGSRFAVYFGAGARLERALIGFMLDIHTRERGFTEVLPPFIANADSLTGTGNLPKFEEDLFKLEGYRLVPHPDGRGAADQHLPERDPGRTQPARRASSPTRRASGARPAPTARTSAASSASTSSTRSR